MASLLLFPSGLPAAEPQGTSYRYDFMWPQIDQPWYFHRPRDVAVATDGSVYVADTWNHRIQQFSATGTFLRSWGSKGGAPGQFTFPSGIAAAPDGSVYVADADNARIQQFDATGAFLAAWGSWGDAEGQFEVPRGIAVAPDGTVYVADTGNRRIQHFSAAGVFLRAWGGEGSAEGQFGRGYDVYGGPLSLTVAQDGTLYVTDTENHRIQQFSATGDFLNTWGGEGTGQGNFSRPHGIAVTPDGTLYISDTNNNRIQQFSATGTFLRAWGSPGGPGSDDWQFDAPYGISVAPDGSVYVADYGNHRVQQFSEQGTFLSSWNSSGSAQGQFRNPMSITLAPDGTVYVADSDNHRIQQFSANGAFLRTFGGFGRAGGQFDWPGGIAAAPNGDLYVADTFNHRIQQFSANGSFLRTWGDGGDAEGQFQNPFGIAVAPDNTVYVADTGNHRIQQFSATGSFLRAWGSFGSAHGEFRSPETISVAPNGLVYVADTWNNRIQQFSSTGEFLSSWVIRDEIERPFHLFDHYFNHSLLGIAAAPDGTLYVADGSRDRIQQLDSSGSLLGIWGSFGSDAGAFSFPADIDVNSLGQVYVADLGNNRIQVFRRSLLEVTQEPDGLQVIKTPKALIIAGRTAVGDALDTQAQTLMIRQVYATLQAQGYMSDASHDDLRVLWSGQPIQTGPNSELQTDVANKATLNALKPWAASADRLLLYLIGHGIKNAFYLNAIEGEQELLGAGDLDAWLDDVQTSLTDDLTVIYEACHAGSFLDPLKGEKRLLLASAGAEERALFGYNGLNSYSYQFWLELGAGRDLKTAHENASKRLEGQSSQQPLLDANANAIGNERADLSQSQDRCIGIEVNEEGKLVRGCKGYLSPPPQIENIASDQDLNGEQRAELWLTVDPSLAGSIIDAWALLTRPDQHRDDSQSFDRLPVITLQRDDAQAGRWKATYAPGGKNRQGETYQGFDVQGDYQLAYYVKNSDGLLSSPKLGEVTQTQGSTVDNPDPSSGTGSNAKLINLSTRGQINAGDGALVGGFVLQGNDSQQILIKGIGPSLAAAGLTGVLSDPELTLYLNGSEITSNDDWEIGAQANQIRSLNPPADAREPALLLTLDPGIYTASVSGKNGSTGIGMVEINVIGNSTSELVNLSTRGQINAGDGAMVGGFVLQGSESKQVLIKGVGPVLTAAGIAGALSDPQLTLHAGGIEIARNDDWQSSFKAAQILQQLQPGDTREPAILATLSPGAYTATVSGSNGATGIGMVEVYVVE